MRVSSSYTPAKLSRTASTPKAQEGSCPPEQDQFSRTSFAQPSKVRLIASKTDPVQRNFEITQSYHELSEGMRKLLGDEAGPSWTTWACWASKHLGSTIRGEDHPWVRATARVAHSVLGSVLPATFTPAALLAQTSEAMAEANHNIYKRTAPKFANFLEAFADGKPNSEKLNQFLEKNCAADEELLVSAFTLYHNALAENDPKKRKDLVLLANLQVVHDEQIHAHPEIQRGIPRFAAWPMTRYSLALGFADESVRLGLNMPEAQAPQEPGIRHYFQEFSPDGCSAMRDYRNLDCRMRFIVHLFSNYHNHSQLFRPPFRPDQVAELERGQPIEDRH